MAKRRTFQEIEAAARRKARDDTIAEVCRVLRWHLGNEDAANALWKVMNEPGNKMQKASDNLQRDTEARAPLQFAAEEWRRYQEGGGA